MTTTLENNIKYWVSDLSDEAQDLLVKHCTQQLEEMGYCNDEINRYVEDLPFEKLGNLSELISYETMIELSIS